MGLMADELPGDAPVDMDHPQDTPGESTVEPNDAAAPPSQDPGAPAPA
jgi:hypothetical protein